MRLECAFEGRASAMEAIPTDHGELERFDAGLPGVPGAGLPAVSSDDIGGRNKR